MANSLSELVEDEIVRTRFVINAVAARENVIKLALRLLRVLGWELLDEVDIEQLARQAANRAIMMLDARPAPAGRAGYVQEAGGTMVHEAWTRSQS